MNNKKNSGGFTLVEIAIVLVIIGLLLGGILKGQELINNAKVRAIADRQSALKVAWFAFIDRFGGIPGDYVNADRDIPGSLPSTCTTAVSVAAAACSKLGDGLILEQDSAVVFQHLTGAGYIRCGECNTAVADGDSLPSASNHPVNTYGGVLSIWQDGTNVACIAANPCTSDIGRLQLHTGPRIPSNIIAEVDRKIDDGSPYTGDFVFNQYDPQGFSPTPVTCAYTDLGTGATGVAGLAVLNYAAVAGTKVIWRPIAQAQPQIETNCGASIYI